MTSSFQNGCQKMCTDENNYVRHGTSLVGRGPTLDAHVGLGTTAMSGFVPLVLSFRVWLSIIPSGR